jgi:hypothetical protein
MLPSMNTFAPDGFDRMTVEDEQAAVVSSVAAAIAAIDRVNVVRIADA